MRRKNEKVKYIVFVNFGCFHFYICKCYYARYILCRWKCWIIQIGKNEIKDFKKIYLDSEKIKVLLFKGHSYVKASYNFKNITDKDIELIMGYPVDVITTYNGGKIDFKSLRYLEIYINKKKIKTNFYEIKNSDELINDNIEVNLKYNYNKWYIFKVNFKKIIL